MEELLHPEWSAEKIEQLKGHYQSILSLLSPKKEGAAALPSSQQLQGSPKGGSALTGQYQHSIDAKGRVFIPAKLREELGETFYVTMGMDSCLSVYSDASWVQ